MIDCTFLSLDQKKKEKKTEDFVEIKMIDMSKELTKIFKTKNRIL